MKKRNIIFIIMFILIVFLLLGAYFINKKRDNNITSEIKNTIFNQISKDGIVVKDIKIIQDGKNIKLITTIKNKTNSNINELFISVNLLDKDGKYVTTIATRIEELIAKNGTSEFTAHAKLDNEDTIIKSAEISEVDIQSKKAITDNFNRIEQSFE